MSSRASLAWLVLAVALLADDSTGQAAWREVPELSARSGHAMAYDPVRRRLVLYGGSYATGFSDTWEWDGQTWHERTPNTSPGVRIAHSMAFDPVSQRVILFGGWAPPSTPHSDTWAWDGKTWQKVNSTSSPPARYGAAMATDSKRRRVVLFGGFGAAFTTPFADTWEWDGKTWTRRYPNTVPPARGEAVMAFNPATQRVLLAGGQAWVGIVPPDVFEWTGRDWLKLRPLPVPSNCSTRCWPAMASDFATNSVYVAIPGALHRIKSDIHLRWDGAKWTQLTPAPAPQLFAFAGMAADTNRKQIIMFGGQPRAPIQPGDDRATWSWNGTSWKKVHVPIKPWGTIVAAAADPIRDEIVILEGLGTTSTWVLRGEQFVRMNPSQQPPGLDRLVFHWGLRGVFGYDARNRTNWLWDGRQWIRQTVTTGPASGTYVYDTRRDRVVLYHGTAQLTWEWDTNQGWQLRKKGAGPKLTGFDYLRLQYDPKRGRVVAVVVGNTYTSRPEVWEWSGITWTKMAPANRPGNKFAWRLEYVPFLGGVVLFGGYNVQSQLRVPGVDDWLWDGSNWTKLANSPLPSPLPGMGSFVPSASAYDVGRRRIVTFYSDPNMRPRSNTWELVPDELRLSERHPRPNERFQATINVPSQANRPFVLALAGRTWPGIPVRIVPWVGVEQLPLAPDTLFWSSFGLGLVTVLDARGAGSFGLRIPNDKALHWLKVYAAGFTIGPRLGITAVTNHVSFEIVR